LNSLDILTEINLDDLAASFGWQNSPRLAGTLRRLFRGPARKLLPRCWILTGWSVKKICQQALAICCKVMFKMCAFSVWKIYRILARSWFFPTTPA